MRVRWLLAATLAHGVIIAFLWLVPAVRIRRTSEAPRAPVPRAAIEIQERVEPPQVPAPGEHERAPPALERRDSEHGRQAMNAHGAGPRARPSIAEAAPEPEAQAPQDVAPAPTLSAEALGLAGRNIFLGRLPSAPERPREPEHAPENMAPGIEQSLREAIVEDDRRHGFSAGGSVASVAEELVRASATPVNSDARLDVTVNASGTVSEVVVAAASEAFGEWEQVAGDLQTVLRGRTFHVPRGSSGLAIALEVTSREERPSGHDVDTEVNLFGVPVKKVASRSKHPNRVDVLKPEAKTVDVVQPSELSPPIKFPQKQRLASAAVGYGFDPVDLGAHGKRVVHVRVLKERAL